MRPWTRPPILLLLLAVTRSEAPVVAERSRVGVPDRVVRAPLPFEPTSEPEGLPPPEPEREPSPERPIDERPSYDLEEVTLEVDRLWDDLDRCGLTFEDLGLDSEQVQGFLDQADDRLDRGVTSLGNYAVLKAFYDVGEQRMIEQGCQPTGEWI